MRKARDFNDFLTWFPEEQGKLMAALRAFLQEGYPQLREGIKYGGPFWTGRKGILYLDGGKEGVYLGFIEGHRMADLHGLLQGSGSIVRKYFVRGPQDLHPMRLSALVEEALFLDGYYAANGWN